MNYLPTEILLGSKKVFNYLEPKLEDIDLKDIAHNLSNICRYGGNCPKFYSVAEHCVLGAIHVYEDTGSAKKALAFLLHDAGESYVGDIPTPLKTLLPLIKEIEEEIMVLVHEKFDIVISPDTEALIKDYDRRIFWSEFRDFHGQKLYDRSKGEKPLPIIFNLMVPEDAEKMFLDAFHQYSTWVKEEAKDQSS